jgi:hypothetical protein
VCRYAVGGGEEASAQALLVGRSLWEGVKSYVSGPLTVEDEVKKGGPRGLMYLDNPAIDRKSGFCQVRGLRVVRGTWKAFLSSVALWISWLTASHSSKHWRWTEPSKEWSDGWGTFLC